MPKQIYERNRIGDTLTREQIEELQQFGALEWEPRDMAIYFSFDIAQFTAEYNDPESIVTLAITRGRLQALATINKKLLSNAEAGDLPAINHLEKSGAKSRSKPRNSTYSALSTTRKPFAASTSTWQKAARMISRTTKSYFSTCSRSSTP
ncbi:MAG: hypothetical protein ACLUGU_12135 [Alistipes shahii]